MVYGSMVSKSVIKRIANEMDHTRDYTYVIFQGELNNGYVLN